MSTQRGNVRKSGPQKYQNKSGFKNVYHDTSKKTKTIVNTVVSGVCTRCKDIIDWKIKYKKYKPLTQPKTCVTCKQKTVKQAYHIHCLQCSGSKNICAKCGDKKDIVLRPEPSEAEQAAEERQLQFELEHLPERKRRTILRLQEKGLLPSGEITADVLDSDSGSGSEEEQNDSENELTDDLCCEHDNPGKKEQLADDNGCPVNLDLKISDTENYKTEETHGSLPSSEMSKNSEASCGAIADVQERC